MRNFLNNNNLSEIILLERLRKLDPYVKFYMYLEGDETLTPHPAIQIESTLTDQQITSALSTSQSADETASIQAFEAAATGFESLPNWATWTISDFNTWCDANLMTDAQIDASTLSAALKTNLKANNAFTRNVGKAVLYLRDYAIKLRR